MKALYLLFHGFDKANGISKKIHYQVKALGQCGLDIRTCYYDVAPNGHRSWMVDGEVLADLGCGMSAKIRKRLYFAPIVAYARREGIGFVYIRSYHNANPFTLYMVKRLKALGAKVVMEIPTYPYDQEYVTRSMKLDLWVDRSFRRPLACALDGIVTFSNETTIFGGKTIRISNGIDFDAIPMKCSANDTSRELHLLAVAEVHYWHGIDRLVRGLANYYRSKPEYKVYFHIVGALSGERERQEILPVIRENGLEPYVLLHGPLHGTDLDEIFEQADFGIGSLGRHRSGITHIKTLKNREYAARGLAFVYSEMDDDFDPMPYTLKASPDESPINISQLVDFYKSNLWNPQQIRDSIKHLSWTEQMRIVTTEIKNIRK